MEEYTTFWGGGVIGLILSGCTSFSTRLEGAAVQHWHQAVHPSQGFVWQGRDPGVFFPLLFECAKLRYLKGLFLNVNSSSALMRGIVRHVLSSALPGPMVGDWDSVRLWLAEYGLTLLPSTSPFLTSAHVEFAVLRAAVGSVIAISDGSREERAHGWAVILVDAEGIMAWAYSGARLHSGSSWAAEWCAKGLALWLLRHLAIPPSQVLGFVAHNLGASFGSAGGGGQCIWVDAVVRFMPPFSLTGVWLSTTCLHSTTRTAKMRWPSGRRRRIASPRQGCGWPAPSQSLYPLSFLSSTSCF